MWELSRTVPGSFFQVESSERAIAEVNGSLVGGVQLKVVILSSSLFDPSDLAYLNLLTSYTGVTGKEAACNRSH